MAEIDTPMYDLTVGPPSPSLKQELFPKRGWAGLQLVTDKSRPISTVAWSIVVPVLLGKELGFALVVVHRYINGLPLRIRGKVIRDESEMRII